jgi:glyoxylase-like metal-dependent hydrolase (beta-lactamase superfamily II)
VASPEVTGPAHVDVIGVVDEGLGNSSYLVDLGDGRALAVDPSRDLRALRDAAIARQLRIALVAETHLHADFVSGSREVAAATGATILAPAAARLDFGHTGLEDGDEVDLGGLRLRALATPGHTPEHLAFLLLDGTGPLGVFSGGSLIVGSAARTDLIAPEKTEALTRALYRSIRGRLFSLPDDTPVYPTHGAGSFCSAPPGADRTSTIGRERATNRLLAAPDEDAFVALLLGELGSYPDYFLRLRDVNRRGPGLRGQETPRLPALSVPELRRVLDQGAELIDVRPVGDFAAGHVPGALSIPLRPAFASWLGWLVLADRRLVFILAADQDRDDLVWQCLKVGYEQLAGELAGGMPAWRAGGLDEGRVTVVDPDHVGGQVLDVRQHSEFDSGHIPGAVHIELGSLGRHTADAPPGELTVMCGHGERAMTAASILARVGRTDLTVLAGGAEDWARRTGRRLQTES